MSNRLSTCKGCTRKITKEEKHIYSGKSYCKNCYDELYSDNQDRLLLYKTICEYFCIEVPTGLMTKQVKEYKEQFKYSYSGMTYTLYYIKEIEGKSFDTKYGIAYVKFYYESAKSYFEQQQRISESVSIIDLQEEKVVEAKIGLSRIYSKSNDFLFDLNNLAQEVE